MANRSLSAVKVVVQLQATVRNIMDDGSIASGPVNANISDTIANGISVGQANRAWQWVNHVLASGETGIMDVRAFGNNDMGAGDGNDIVGQVMDTIEEIVAIVIKNENAEGVAGELEIRTSGVVADGFTQLGDHPFIVSPGLGGSLGAQGVLLKYSPNEDTWSTGAARKNVYFAAHGGDVTYSVYILGRSDDDESSSSISTSSSSSSISTSSSSISTSSISTSSISTSSSSSSISTSSISTSSSSNSSSSQSELP